MNKSVFIVSKPLQYFNASNIDDANYKVLLIVDGFSDSVIFYENVKAESKLWQEVYYFSDHYSAIKWCSTGNFEKLYLDSDYGFHLSRYLRTIQSQIYVYEEGVGSYQAELRRKISNNLNKRSKIHLLKDQVLLMLQKLQGNADYHGGFNKTKGIYLYNPDLHRQNVPQFKKKRLSFKNAFREHLSQFPDKKIIDGDRKLLISSLVGKKVLLYLSMWFIDEETISTFDAYDNTVKILKPHPHLKWNADSQNIKCKFDEIINGGSMAEFLINDLLTVVDQLIVVHHGSSALEYFKNEPKLVQIVI